MVVVHEREAMKNGEKTMATEFGEQTSEHALLATDFDAKWVREIAEQSLNQTRITLIGFWNIGKEITDHLEKQSSAVRHHATALAEKSLLNTLDLGQKWLFATGPGEFIQLQADFFSRQAQMLSEQTLGLGEGARQAAQQAMLGVYEGVLESARKGESAQAAKAEHSARRQRA